MGMNYYLRYNECKCCDRYDELHIGKKSYGWEFSFEAHHANDDRPAIRSWKDWQAFLEQHIANGSRIVNEEGVHVTLDDFYDVVTNSRNRFLRFRPDNNAPEEWLEPQNHFDYCLERRLIEFYAHTYDWKDEEGWSFHLGEFS